MQVLRGFTTRDDVTQHVILPSLAGLERPDEVITPNRLDLINRAAYVYDAFRREFVCVTDVDGYWQIVSDVLEDPETR